ncbi:hypothetical protein BJ508DRAFT_327754 [Ascobolus immersus RN42]|uniref:Uncharacterized protein n=1 Tax=Ascobolus immersus RN42 TaxID=1160509 RepID=A0A3N4I274_ASCIM|nr:hypothetical protein BJ508DRAFT_327754 [Ascobolus immersus RN42]
MSQSSEKQQPPPYFPGTMQRPAASESAVVTTHTCNCPHCYMGLDTKTHDPSTASAQQYSTHPQLERVKTEPKTKKELKKERKKQEKERRRMQRKAKPWFGFTFSLFSWSIF